MIDMEGTDGRDPLADYRVLANELKLYMPGLARKPELVCANKMDEPEAPENLKIFRDKVKKEIFAVSCVSEEGFKELKAIMLKEVLAIRSAESESGQ
jgi:GTP-binding protein